MKDILISFSGGINNVNTELELYLRKLGETPTLTNVDTTLQGRLKLLRPLTALNSVAATNSIHSIFRAQDIILLGYYHTLGYLADNVPTYLIAMTDDQEMSMAHAGNWVFVGNGTDNRAVYLPTPVGTLWGQSVPGTAPTVEAGAAGNPDDTYTCYYRYKITLPDDSIIRTGLSPLGTVTVANKKILWSALVHASFTGATTVQIELLRTASGWSGTYLVATLDEGTTSYVDNEADATVQANTAFAETDYYPPPNGVNLAIYHPGADRMFAVVDNKAYWSLAGQYHVFQYDSVAAEYTNVNSVFLDGENITGVALFDEQLYFGSPKGWRRLRGKNPSSWQWESTAAMKGPISWRSVAVTPYGVIYVGNDGYIWIFNGITARKLIQHYTFSRTPDSTCHGVFDGRFYRLFYATPTLTEARCEIVLDLYGYPEKLRVIDSTRSATASYYDTDSNEFYLADSSGYVRNGEDVSQSVTLTVKTCEIPAEDLRLLENKGALLIQANTGDADLSITPYQDEVAQTALKAFTSSSLVRSVLPLPFNVYRSLSFLITITTAEDIELREPFIVCEGDSG